MNNPEKPDTDKPTLTDIPVRKHVEDTLNGVGATEIVSFDDIENLTARVYEGKTATGDSYLAATDKGIGRDENQDCLLIDPTNNLFVVIDGVGSGKNSKQAAISIAEGFREKPKDPAQAIEKACDFMKNDGVSPDPDSPEYGGACFASVRMVEKSAGRYLEVAKSGDVKVLILKNNSIVWESHDDSDIQQLIDAKILTGHEPYYSPYAGQINKMIGPEYHSDDFEIVNPDILLEKGMRIIVMTDGITDNIVPIEIEKHLQKHPNLSSRELLEWLSAETDKRMINAQETLRKTDELGGREKLETYPDGWLNAPKQDNRGLVIVDVQ